MHFLKDLFQPETLSVVSCHHVDDEGLESISHVSTHCFGAVWVQAFEWNGIQGLAWVGAPIATLNASNCSHLTDEGVAAVGHLSKLTKLDLRNCIQITDVGAMALGKGASAAFVFMSWSELVSTQ